MPVFLFLNYKFITHLLQVITHLLHVITFELLNKKLPSYIILNNLYVIGGYFMNKAFKKKMRTRKLKFILVPLVSILFIINLIVTVAHTTLESTLNTFLGKGKNCITCSEGE